jgi:murein DD-endopeptidase MepM/ murein hydrolase activator NlpD
MRATVVQAGDSGGGLGNVVITKGSLPYDVWATDLGNQVQTIPAKTPFYLIYAHLDRVMASTGQTVTPGRQIGTIGETGFTFGPHLHLELRIGNFNNRWVLNPMDMLIASIVGLQNEIVYA